MDGQEESAASAAYNYHQHRLPPNNYQLFHQHPHQFDIEPNSQNNYLITQPETALPPETIPYPVHLKQEPVQQPPASDYIQQPLSNGDFVQPSWPVDVSLPPDSYQRPPRNIYDLRQFEDCEQPPPPPPEMSQVPSTSTAAFLGPPEAPRKPAIMYQYQQARNQQFIPPSQRSPPSVIRHTTEVQFQQAPPPQLPPPLDDNDCGPFQIMNKPSRSHFLVINGKTFYPDVVQQAPPPPPPPQVDFEHEFNSIMEEISIDTQLQLETNQLSIDNSFSLQSSSSSVQLIPQRISEPVLGPLLVQGPSIAAYSEAQVPLLDEIYTVPSISGKPRRGRGKTNLNPGRDPTVSQSPAKSPAKSPGRGRKKTAGPVAISPAGPSVAEFGHSNAALVNQFHSMSVSQTSVPSPDITDFKVGPTRGRGRGGGRGTTRTPRGSDPKPRKKIQRPEAVSKSMAMNVQSAIGIYSQATPEAVPGPSLVSIKQEVVYACEPVPVGFQPTQESLAALKTEQETDTAHPEAEQNPPAVGEVSGHNVILDPNVDKVISGGLVFRPKKVKRQYIRLPKPKVPMQESTLLNIENKQVERVKAKKASKGGKGAPKTDAVVKPPEVNVKVIPTKFTKPVYSQQEKDFLYADGKFVIRVGDLDLSPNSIHIWRICRAEKYLLQFYPCRHAEQQYFQTSAVTWYFTDEDFTSDEFYDSFQPIIVVVANSRTLGVEDPSKFCPLTRMDLTIVQYVHSVEKGFMQRMAKYIGKIDKTEAWQPIFMSALPIVTLLVFNETLVSDERIVPGYREHREHYLQLQSQTKALLDKVANKFYKKAFDQICEYPELQFKYDVDKTATCGACLNRARPRARYARVVFDGSAVDKVPYNPDSFRSLPSAKTKKFPENVFWCKACSLRLKKIHRLAHYWYHLWRLIKQNVLYDIEHFLSMDVQPTDELILWTQSKNISWKNIMFANFQLTYAEVEDELCGGDCYSPEPVITNESASIPPPTPPPPEAEEAVTLSSFTNLQNEQPSDMLIET